MKKLQKVENFKGAINLMKRQWVGEWVKNPIYESVMRTTIVFNENYALFNNYSFYGNTNKGYSLDGIKMTK